MASLKQSSGTSIKPPFVNRMLPLEWNWQSEGYSLYPGSNTVFPGSAMRWSANAAVVSEYSGRPTMRGYSRIAARSVRL